MWDYYTETLLYRFEEQNKYPSYSDMAFSPFGDLIYIRSDEMRFLDIPDDNRKDLQTTFVLHGPTVNMTEHFEYMAK